MSMLESPTKSTILQFGSYSYRCPMAFPFPPFQTQPLADLGFAYVNVITAVTDANCINLVSELVQL